MRILVFMVKIKTASHASGYVHAYLVKPIFSLFCQFSKRIGKLWHAHNVTSSRGFPRWHEHIDTVWVVGRREKVRPACPSMSCNLPRATTRQVRTPITTRQGQSQYRDPRTVLLHMCNNTHAHTRTHTHTQPCLQKRIAWVCGSPTDNTPREQETLAQRVQSPAAATRTVVLYQTWRQHPPILLQPRAPSQHAVIHAAYRCHQSLGL